MGQPEDAGAAEATLPQAPLAHAALTTTGGPTSATGRAARPGSGARGRGRGRGAATSRGALLAIRGFRNWQGRRLVQTSNQVNGASIC